jgi:hypothetical protein
MKPLTIKDVHKDKQYVCVIEKQQRSCFNKRRADLDVQEVLGSKKYTYYKTKGYFPYEIIAHHYVSGEVVIPVVSGAYLLEHKETILWDRCFIISTEETFRTISDFIFKSKEMKEEDQRHNDSWDKKVMEVAFEKGDMATIDGTLPRAIANDLKDKNKWNRYRIARTKWDEYLRLQNKKAA